MKTVIPVVYVGSLPEVRVALPLSEKIAKRNGDPIDVPAGVAVEFIQRADWKCANESDAADVQEEIEILKAEKEETKTETETPGN